MTQAVGTQPPRWETWIGFLVPGFGLAQPWLSWAFGRVTSGVFGFKITGFHSYALWKYERQ